MLTYEQAAELIGSMIYKPGWTFTTEPWNRFENTLLLHIGLQIPNFNAEFAPDYAGPLMTVDRKFPLCYGLCDDPDTLLYQITEAIMAIEAHELREAMRVPDGRGNWHAPFHPHNLATMQAWAARSGEPVLADLAFDAWGPI